MKKKHGRHWAWTASLRPECFLLVDLRDCFQIEGRGGAKKSSGNDQLTGDWSFSEHCFNISRTNSKTRKVNQQYVFNL